MWSLGYESKDDGGVDPYYAGYIDNGIAHYGVGNKDDAKSLCDIFNTGAMVMDKMIARIQELEAQETINKKFIETLSLQLVKELDRIAELEALVDRCVHFNAEV